MSEPDARENAGARGEARRRENETRSTSSPVRTKAHEAEGVSKPASGTDKPATTGVPAPSHASIGSPDQADQAIPSQTARATFQPSQREWLFLLAVAVATAALGYLTEEWLGVIGVAGTLVGLVIAIRQILIAQAQIARTLSVAEATRAAVTQTQDQLARQDLLRLVPDLQRVEKELNNAARLEDEEAIASHLATWRNRAYEFIGLLEDRPYANDELVAELYGTAKMAAALVVEMPDAGQQARVETKRVRADISGVCGRLGLLESKLRLDTGQEQYGTVDR